MLRKYTCTAKDIHISLSVTKKKACNKREDYCCTMLCYVCAAKSYKPDPSFYYFSGIILFFFPSFPFLPFFFIPTLKKNFYLKNMGIFTEEVQKTSITFYIGMWSLFFFLKTSKQRVIHFQNS